MEYNKDESIRCLELAKSYLAKGEKTKAVKFATKSEQLYPSEEARAFIGKINQQGKADSRSGADNINTASSNGVRSRKKAESNGVSGAYTEEQVRAVKRIKQCKDYYEILGIERYADENEIKKKYRKLALQFHPDKNHAPGAAEAFKAISNAFSVLSDQSKRRKYDVSGPDNSSNGNRNNREWDYSHGFESEMSPDEIFNMFFGGGNFTTETHTNGNGATAHTFRRHHHQNSEDWHQLLLQLSPVLILVILSVFSMSYTGNNPYSLSQNNEYSEKRTTENLQVVYFVMPDFGKKYHKGSVHRIEQEIEGLYISNLRNECYQERITKEKLMRLAKNSNDAKAFEKAETFDMKNCRRLRHLI